MSVVKEKHIFECLNCKYLENKIFYGSVTPNIMNCPKCDCKVVDDDYTL